MTLIHYGRCSNLFYNTIIKILGQLTLPIVKWGYVRSKHRIKYITSVDVPVKIGACYGKSYEKRQKYKFDIDMTPYIHHYSRKYTKYIEYNLAHTLLLYKLPILLQNQLVEYKPHKKMQQVIDEINRAKLAHNTITEEYIHNNLLTYDTYHIY
jgi:hypothetical protein